MRTEREAWGGTLTDAGALVALILTDNSYSARCAAALPRIMMPLITTPACLTEAFHLLGRASGFPAQAALWDWFLQRDVRLLDWSENDTERARAFVFRYQPFCDYADATLLVTAKRTGLRRVFTIDGYFFAYRLTDAALLVLLGPGR